MFAGPVCPSAVFVGNDHMAFALMDVLRFELGLSVPGDVSVIGVLSEEPRLPRGRATD